SEQMKMFLTRLGFNSKAVITGDVTQVDLPTGRRSGLIEAIEVVKNVEGISFIYFSERDVVRHNLVQRIIRAYEEHDQARAGGGKIARELQNYLGDIVISMETARENARAEGHSTSREIDWLILHGTLHLLGYDHATDEGEMTRLERRLRSRLRIE